MLRRLPIIAVLGSGAPITAERASLAQAVGALVARRGAHLLTGAGFGVMEAAAEGFAGVENRAGFSIGIIPRDSKGAIDAPKFTDGKRYPNRFIELAIFSALPSRVSEAKCSTTASRNHVNVLSAHGLVALPGGEGTANELALAQAFPRSPTPGIGPAARPVLLIGPHEEFPASAIAAFAHAATFDQAAPELTRIIESCARALGVD